MVAYEVEIYTGTKPEAETESKISINLVDTKGDSGKGRLHQSRGSKARFRHAQVKKGLIIPAILPLVSFMEDIQTENS